MGSSWLLGSGKYPLKQSHRHWHTVPLLSGNAGEVIPTLPQALLGFSRAAEPLSQGCISHRHLALQRASPPPQDTVFPVTRSTFSVELALSSSLPSVRPLESAQQMVPALGSHIHGMDEMGAVLSISRACCTQITLGRQRHLLFPQQRS